MPKNPYDSEVMVFTDTTFSKSEMNNTTIIGIGSTLIIVTLIGIGLFFLIRSKIKNRRRRQSPDPDIEIPTITKPKRRTNPTNIEESV